MCYVLRYFLLLPRIFHAVTDQACSGELKLDKPGKKFYANSWPDWEVQNSLLRRSRPM